MTDDLKQPDTQPSPSGMFSDKAAEIQRYLHPTGAVAVGEAAFYLHECLAEIARLQSQVEALTKPHTHDHGCETCKQLSIDCKAIAKTCDQLEEQVEALNRERDSLQAQLLRYAAVLEEYEKAENWRRETVTEHSVLPPHRATYRNVSTWFGKGDGPSLAKSVLDKEQS